jgi:hypothetical protein
MHSLRLILALALGFLAMEALVFTAGVLAARSIPASYFALFGAQHRELALGLLGVFTFSLPQFVIAASLAATAAWAVRSTTWYAPTLFLFGALICIAVYVYSASRPIPELGAPGRTLVEAAADFLPRELWQLPNGPWASLVGLVVGWVLWLRRATRHVRAEA